VKQLKVPGKGMPKLSVYYLIVRWRLCAATLEDVSLQDVRTYPSTLGRDEAMDETPHLPFQQMREGFNYEYIGGEKIDQHLDLRRGIVARVKAMCTERGLDIRMCTPEQLNWLATWTTEFEAGEVDEDIIAVDGSDRAHVCTVAAIAGHWADV
jgi:hypothetical protein